MLITVSGIVGSGKSNVSRRLVSLLAGSQRVPKYHRFRHLKALNFTQLLPANRPGAIRREAPNALRGCGFKLRPLTAGRATAYALQILAFRLSRMGTGGRCDVLDRYFYDSFAQYSLTSRKERLYLRMLRRAIPAPDLAVLLIARDETIESRRLNYAQEYVSVVGHQYRELSKLFPNLKIICTDPGYSVDDEIQQLVQGVVNRPRH
jgi:thymidylate kinase